MVVVFAAVHHTFTASDAENFPDKLGHGNWICLFADDYSLATYLQQNYAITRNVENGFDCRTRCQAILPGEAHRKVERVS
jgi:hypothetical protein